MKKKELTYKIEILKEQPNFYSEGEFEYATKTYRKTQWYPFVHVEITSEEAVEVLAMLTEMRRKNNK